MQALWVESWMKPLPGVQVRRPGSRFDGPPADEGFWVGTGDTDRVWVQLSDLRGASR